MKVPVFSSLILFHARQAGGGYHSLLSLNSVLFTRTYHSADCDTDHSMVASEVRLQPKQIHRSKTKGRLRLNTSNTSNSELCNRFTSLITEALNNYPTHRLQRGGIIYVKPPTCVPLKPLEREKGLALTGLRLAETKLHQLSTPRGLPYYITKETLVKRHLRPSGSQKQYPKNCQTMCEQILARPMSEHSTGSQ